MSSTEIETKKCSACNEIKSVFDYHQSNRRSGARTLTNKYVQSRCKACQVKDRQFYNIRNRNFIAKIKLEQGCASCGYNEHSCALDFHHKNPEEKSFSISSRKVSSASLQKLQSEIDKCETLCANCHRVKHHVGEIDNDTNS